MGSRGHIVVVQHPHYRGKPEGEVYLYTHWGGEFLPLFVQQTLARRKAWDDESYLARMLFCTLVRDDMDEELRFGITTYLTDNEFPLLVLDTQEGRVSLRDPQ